jgi:hypothetical protein
MKKNNLLFLGGYVLFGILFTVHIQDESRTRKHIQTVYERHARRIKTLERAQWLKGQRESLPEIEPIPEWEWDCGGTSRGCE